MVYRLKFAFVFYAHKKPKRNNRKTFLNMDEWVHALEESGILAGASKKKDFDKELKGSACTMQRAQ